MDKITLSNLGSSLQTIYRAGISVCFVVTRDPGSAIKTVMQMEEFSRFVVGAGRPFASGGMMPGGFTGIGEWGDIASLGRVGYPNPTIGLITGYPMQDGANRSLYSDILSAYAESCAAPLLLVILTESESVPPGFSRLGPTIKVLTPNQPEREQILADIAVKNGFRDTEVPATGQALSGLDTGEIRQIGLLQLLAMGHFDPGQAALEKAQRLAAGGFLDIIPPMMEGMAEVGGLDGLKAWLTTRRLAFSPKAEQFGIPRPRGILLVGPPGTGKSLSARAVASSWNFPLARVEMGKIYGSYVGESEKNLRLVLNQLQGMSPVIAWIDEVEKGLSGAQSGSGGSEIARRLLQSLLTALQESTGIFWFMTANDVSALPPELVRKGRLDELFYLDLPIAAERESILRIHLAKRHRDPRAFDIEALARQSEGFSGSELESVVVDGLHTAFGADRDLTTEDIAEALRATKPLSILYPEQIQSIRSWGATHARPAAGTQNSASPETHRLQS